MTSTRVLVVDDEPSIVEFVATALHYEGHEVATAATGRGALSTAAWFRPHLVLLDVMLPDIDGFAVHEGLDAVPVIYLTARGGSGDAVRGLTLGADDYVTKPFSLEELVARVRAVLRRVLPDGSSSLIAYADVELDENTHEVRRNGSLVELTRTEYDLLRYLLLNPRRVLTKAQILDHVWQYDFQGRTNIVELYISYLRRKIDVHGPPLIHTVRGVGYILRQAAA
ncbi:MAG: two-component system, OmpR family, response regulator [Gaiellales bacterium]|jgi:two-component system OmpR family response regulator|nr:two-component system, OmpR family, response regulator [Gaiellales bacterium]MDX6598387.1 two-component system, OmpR family, response regulator [Gaiellales bacterium]